MENSFQTSFIPKKPIDQMVSSKRAPASLFTILTSILLILIIVAAGILFVYKSYLIKQKESLSVSLLKVKDSFEKETIEELELFSQRTDVSEDILSSHIILSPFFELLGELTIPSIQYTSFDHETNEKGFSVKMSGISSDYRSIALQADIFSTPKGHYLKNVIFSNLIKDKSNYVTFDLEFNVDPSLLSYEKNISLEESQESESNINSNPLLNNLNNN